VRWGVAVPLTALASACLYWVTGVGLVAFAVRFLEKEARVRGGVGNGMAVFFHHVLFLLLAVAAAAVSVGGAEAPWRRRGLLGVSGLTLLVLLPWLGDILVPSGWANPNWARVIVVSSAVGLGVPNLVAHRLLARPRTP
jgi:hypothetical protein